jgi:MFS family permease
VGAEVTLFALPLAAVALGAGAREVSWLTAVRFLPLLLLGLPAGVWADRLPRRPLLIATGLVRSAVLASVPLAALAGHLRLEGLFAVAFLVSALAVLAEVGHLAYLPVVVGRRLVAGNSAAAVGQQAARVAGPSLAGALVQVATAPFALLADAACSLAAAGLLGTIRTREPARAHRAGAGGFRVLWREVGDGVRFVVADPVLRPLTGVWALFYFAFWLFWAQYPLYATRDLGLSPAALGLGLSIAAVGGVLGAAVAPPVTARLGAGRTLVASVVGGGAGALCVLLLPGPGRSPAVTTIVLALGYGLVLLTDQLYYVNFATAAQGRAPDRLRGRVGAAIRVLTAGVGVPAGAFLGGVLAEAVGLRATAALASLGVVAAVLWLALSPVRALRTLAGEAEGGPQPAEPPGNAPAGAATPGQPVAEHV